MTPSLPAYAVYARENDDNYGRPLRTSSFVFFSLQDIFIIFRYAHISNDCNCVIFLVVIVHVSHPNKSVDHNCFYNSFSRFHTYVSSSYSFQNRIECTSCNFNSFHNFIITFSICILYLRLWERRLPFVIYVAHNRAYPF